MCCYYGNLTLCAPILCSPVGSNWGYIFREIIVEIPETPTIMQY